MSDLMKTVIELIDETLGEIQELKKSNRFAASEITIEGPGSDLDGKPTNGSLGKEEDKDDDEDKDKDEDEDKDEDKGEDKDAKKSDCGEPKGTCAEKADGAMGEGAAALQRSEEVKKSIEASETLIKSYVDERVGSLEGKLNAITELIQKMAVAPVAPRGVTYRDVKPLAKTDETPTLSKSEVANKLLELKKSGARIDSQDIAKAELGTSEDLGKIVQKYNLK